MADTHTSSPRPASAPTPGPGPRSVLLAGGGSAGHVSPLLALADTLRARWPDLGVTALGTASGLEARLVPQRGYELRVIPRVPMPRRPSVQALRFPGSLAAAVRAAGEAIDAVGAEVVVGFGGYVSSPAYLAARRRRIPIVVHEQNARPGFANRLGARLTPYVATTFASTSLPHATVVGMPLRPEITSLDRAALRDEARAFFDLTAHAPTVLVTGGSLGAKRLNDAFEAAADRCAQAGVQVLHATGAGKGFMPPAPVDGAAPYVVREYLDRMDLAFAAADLVVARAGANTVCELNAVGLPAIYVPLPIGNGEQRFNVADVVAAGGGLVVDDADVTADWVASTVLPLALDPQRLAAMGSAARSVGHLDAADQLADLVVDAWRSRHTPGAGEP